MYSEKFLECLRELKSEKSFREMEKSLGVNATTLCRWVNERTAPPEYVQRLIVEKIKGIK